MSQSLVVFKDFKAYIENQLGKKLKTLTVKSDHGAEYYYKYNGSSE